MALKLTTSSDHGPAGGGDGWGVGAGQLTVARAFARTCTSDASPVNDIGASGPIVGFKSWQTCGSTVGAAVAAGLALAAGTATTSAAVTAARPAKGFRQDNISYTLLRGGRFAPAG
jgi:hypothetical protein